MPLHIIGDGLIFCMKFNIAIALVIFVSCSEINVTVPSEIDERLSPLYERFLLEAEERGLSYRDKPMLMYIIPIDTARGLSFYRDDNIVEIAIDSTFWTIGSDIHKEVLLMHELGHGILKREHNQNCESLMIQGGCKYNRYEANRKEMLDELFSYNRSN